MAEGDEVLPKVRPGIFFTPPAPLPRGRHGLERSDIVAAQRERLLIAATELLAARGYGSLSAKEICSRGGVSLTAFYECFETKEDCVFAAYDRFIEVLVTRMLAITDDDDAWEQYIWAIVREYLDVLRSDPVVARAFQVEMDALGAVAREKRREALTGLAQLAYDLFEERAPTRVADLPVDAYLTVVYGIRQLASDAIDRGDVSLATLSLDGEAWLARFMGADIAPNRHS